MLSALENDYNSRLLFLSLDLEKLMFQDYKQKFGGCSPCPYNLLLNFPFPIHEVYNQHNMT